MSIFLIIGSCRIRQRLGVFSIPFKYSVDVSRKFSCFQNLHQDPCKYLASYHSYNDLTRKKKSFYVHVQSTHQCEMRQQVCGQNVVSKESFIYFNRDSYLSNTKFYAHCSGKKGWENSIYYYQLTGFDSVFENTVFPIYHF